MKLSLGMNYWMGELEYCLNSRFGGARAIPSWRWNTSIALGCVAFKPEGLPAILHSERISRGMLSPTFSVYPTFLIAHPM